MTDDLTCTRCGIWSGMNLLLIVPGQSVRHYVYCPSDRWKPTPWEAILALAAEVSS